MSTSSALRIVVTAIATAALLAGNVEIRRA